MNYSINDIRLTPARKGSMFTACLWYSQDQDLPDYKNSDKMEIVSKVIEGKERLRTNQKHAWYSLIRMIENSDKAVQGSQPLKHGWWRRVIIYENINFKRVYVRTPGIIHHQWIPEFEDLSNGAKLLRHWIAQDSTGDRIISVNPNLVRMKAQFNWEYWKITWQPKIKETEGKEVAQ